MNLFIILGTLVLLAIIVPPDMDLIYHEGEFDKPYEIGFMWDADYGCWGLAAIKDGDNATTYAKKIDAGENKCIKILAFQSCIEEAIDEHIQTKSQGLDFARLVVKAANGNLKKSDADGMHNNSIEAFLHITECYYD